MKTIGIIINPIAGIGGKVGLKGSDGAAILRRALDLGAMPESGAKAEVALRILAEAKCDIRVLTLPGEMGADVCERAGLHYAVAGSITAGHTTQSDTVNAAKLLAKEGAELIVFAGGDGTARDILDAIGTSVPALGIPTGCKIHSGVYALNPRFAGQLLVRCAQGGVRDTKEAEVMDIDEELFRSGVVQARLYGYLRIPNESALVQNMKSGRGVSEAASIEMLSNYIADTWQRDTLYIVGTGSTMAAIMAKKGLPNTLLGVDLVYNGTVIAADCTERQILSALEDHDKAVILVTVIGGQGYIFGRGNQQISAEVIRRVGRENIVVAAAKNKIMSLFGRPLYIDTGVEEINKYLSGYMRVIVGYEDAIMMRVSA